MPIWPITAIRFGTYFAPNCRSFRLPSQTPVQFQVGHQAAQRGLWDPPRVRPRRSPQVAVHARLQGLCCFCRRLQVRRLYTELSEPVFLRHAHHCLSRALRSYGCFFCPKLALSPKNVLRTRTLLDHSNSPSNTRRFPSTQEHTLKPAEAFSKVLWSAWRPSRRPHGGWRRGRPCLL